MMCCVGLAPDAHAPAGDAHSLHNQQAWHGSQSVDIMWYHCCLQKESYRPNELHRLSLPKLSTGAFPQRTTPRNTNTSCSWGLDLLSRGACVHDAYAEWWVVGAFCGHGFSRFAICGFLGLLIVLNSLRWKTNCPRRGRQSVGQHARICFEGTGVAAKDYASLLTGSLYSVTVLQGVIQESVLCSLGLDVFAKFFCGGWWLLKIEGFCCSGQPWMWGLWQRC